MIMKKLTIIITMAGLGKRFREAGYNCPKYMIEAKGKSLFEWSMDSLVGFNDLDTKYIFVVRKEDNCKKFIEEKCANYNISKICIHELNEVTDGQATTCLLALEKNEIEGPILVYNIDTYVEPYEMNSKQLVGDGHIPCFKAEGTHWSFVKLDELGNVIEVREKQRISDNCSLGAYYFSSAELFRMLYNKYYMNTDNLEMNEKYIAPLYNLMINEGRIVTISNISSEKVHVLGTPAELAEFIRL